MILSNRIDISEKLKLAKAKIYKVKGQGKIYNSHKQYVLAIEHKRVIGYL